MFYTYFAPLPLPTYDLIRMAVHDPDNTDFADTGRNTACNLFYVICKCFHFYFA